MNDGLITRSFFALLRSGLWERPLSQSELVEAATLDGAGWTIILQLAKQQTVTGLLYRAVTHLPADFRMPDNYVIDLMAIAGGIAQRNRTKTAVTEQLLAECRAAGLKPVILKGQTVAAFYTHPELRISGDIDLYFPPEEYQQAVALLGGEPAPDGSLHFRRNGVDVDLHDRYFDLHCPQSKLPAIGTPEATILQLSGHILKHAIGAGVGLRQCCDMAAAWHALSGSIDPAKLRDLFRRTSTLRWNRLLFSFLADYLDLPETIFAEDRVSSQPLLRIILEGGNFGHYAESRTGSLFTTDSRRKRNTLSRFIQRLPFSLRFAPRETFATIWGLILGNLG
ncbi:MAG: nucleotidyltransferase family protein [Bacteroidales bacterium]|nr:nucleotidyltransferase family protein [Bacteroidales bacterium]